MHACGHDAHTAILLSAGKILREHVQELDGVKILLLFERGEEGTGMLRYLLRHILSRKLRVDLAHAIHVRPDLPTGRILAKDGPIMAGAYPFSVTLRGRGGHGSRPDLASSPIDCFTAFYSALGALRVKSVSPFEQLTLSVGQVHSGERNNVIPSELTFSGSARFFERAAGQKFAEEFTHLLQHIAAAYRCTYDFGSEPGGLGAPGIPLANNLAAAELARAAVRRRLGAETLIDAPPLMGSESFSFIAELWPSVMIHLGIGNDALGSGADLHSEFFDLDEAAIRAGIAETLAFALEFAQSGAEITPERAPDPAFLDRLWKI
jgi:amidohydrolase